MVLLSGVGYNECSFTLYDCHIAFTVDKYALRLCRLQIEPLVHTIDGDCCRTVPPLLSLTAFYVGAVSDSASANS